MSCLRTPCRILSDISVPGSDCCVPDRPVCPGCVPTRVCARVHVRSEGTSLRTSRSSAGDYSSRTSGSNPSLHSTKGRRIRCNTMGHTSLPHRTDRTSRDISMGRRTMCSSTMDRSDGSSTTRFQRCMAGSRSRYRSSGHKGCLTRSRRCRQSDGHTVSWQTGCQPA